MNAKTITIIFVLITFFILFQLFNTVVGFAFSKQGISALALTFIFYQIYKLRRSSRRKSTNVVDSYYDRINTYSNANHYSASSQYREPNIKKSLWQKFLDYIEEKRRDYYYRKFNKVWAAVQLKYSPEMRCPACSSELTVFTIDIKGCCNYCKTKLL